MLSQLCMIFKLKKKLIKNKKGEAFSYRIFIKKLHKEDFIKEIVDQSNALLQKINTTIIE